MLPLLTDSACILNCVQVIVVLPSNRKDRYDAIKKFCCVDHPVPSQCILQRTLSKKQTIMSVTTKVALQLNCKLGGELWALDIPVIPSKLIDIASSLPSFLFPSLSPSLSHSLPLLPSLSALHFFSVVCV